MKSLIINSCLFKLDSIIKEYESRLIKIDPVLEDNNLETQESIQARFREYDAYKFFDRYLSHLVIESLVSPSFCKFVNTRFSQYEKFE